MYSRFVGVVVALGIVGCGDNLTPVERVGPDTVIDRAPAALSAETRVEITFQAVGPAASFTCALDGGAAAACTSPWAFDVTDGDHTVAIIAIGDDGGVGAPATASFTVDTTAPDTVISVGPGAVETTSMATFTFAASPAADGDTFECAVDDAGFTPCTSPATVMRPDGPHTFRVRATDALGHVDATPAMHAWTIDTLGPPLQLTQRPANPSNVATPTFAFSSSDAGATFECQLDGVTTFAACTSPYTTPSLADRAHTFRVRATDASQHQTSLSYTWTVDTVAPTVDITSGPSGPVSTATPAFAFTTSADATAVACAVDGGTFAPCTSPLTTSTLGEGAHTFTVRATDAAGNAATAGRSFTVDTIQPTVTIVSGPGGPTRTATPTWTFTTTDTPTVVECALDGGAAAPCAGSFTPATALGDGPHTFTVRVADAAGNQGTDTRSITVDTDPPVVTVTGGPTGLTLDTTPTFTFTVAGTFTASRCRIDTAAFTACADTFTPSPLGGGPHTFEVEAEDAAGNVGTATRAFEVDGSAPTIFITAAPPAATDDPTPAFEFVAGATAATVECRIDGGAFAPCASPFTVAPALAEGSHTFEVQACTAVPVCASDSHDFTVDVTAPGLTITAGPEDPTPTAATQPTFAFTATDATAVTCRITSAASPTPPFAPCTTSFAPTGQLADGAYTFEVVATDAAGNATTRTRAFTVDTTGPVITVEPPPIPVRTSAVRPVVFFTATDPSGVTTTCRVDGGADVACDGATGFAAGADLVDGPHTYHVTATDGAGNPSVADVGFEVDRAPPTVTITGGPTDPTSDDSPTFDFTTSADTTRARCQLDSGQIIDPCTTGVTFTAAPPGARTFTVTAFDDAVPANTASATYTFELRACGNGVVDAGEECDGGQLGGATCTSEGFDSGTLRCTAACTFDVTGCGTCGDGEVNGDEPCDGPFPVGTTCESLGHAAGTLASCETTCDFSSCDGGFVAASTGFTGRLCFDGLEYGRAPGTVVAACTEDAGVFRHITGAVGDPIAWAGANGAASPMITNLRGRAVAVQVENGSVAFLTDNSTSINGFRSNNFETTVTPTTWMTQIAFATAGQAVEMFAARLGTSTNNVLGGWHPTLGAVALRGFTATAPVSPVGPSVTGTVTSVATGVFSLPSTDVLVAVHGKTPAGATATGGGIYWTCNFFTAAPAAFVTRDDGIPAADKPLVWSLTADPSTFTSAMRMCPSTGGMVSGYATTYYAALRGGGQIYKTIDGGVSWTRSNTGLPAAAEVYTIAIDCWRFAAGFPQWCPDPNLLYAATSVGLYRSSNAGATWTLAGLEGKSVRAVTLQPEHAAGTAPRVFAGIDNATTPAEPAIYHKAP